MERDTLYGFACLLVGTTLVAVQLLFLWRASKVGAVAEVRKRARVVADAAGSAAAQAEAASLAAESAVLRASSIGSSAGWGAEGMSDLLQQTDTAMESMSAAKEHARQAKQKAKEAQEEAQGSTINDVLASIAGKAPVGVLGFLFAVLGAMSMGLVEISFGTASGG